MRSNKMVCTCPNCRKSIPVPNANTNTFFTCPQCSCNIAFPLPPEIDVTPGCFMTAWQWFVSLFKCIGNSTHQ